MLEDCSTANTTGAKPARALVRLCPRALAGLVLLALRRRVLATVWTLFGKQKPMRRRPTSQVHVHIRNFAYGTLQQIIDTLSSFYHLISPVAALSC